MLPQILCLVFKNPDVREFTLLTSIALACSFPLLSALLKHIDRRARENTAPRGIEISNGQYS
jgi:predicted outer membrane lipoprotein